MITHKEFELTSGDKLTVEMSDQFIKLIANHYGVSKDSITEKLIKNFVHSMLTSAIEK